MKKGYVVKGKTVEGLFETHELKNKSRVKTFLGWIMFLVEGYRFIVSGHIENLSFIFMYKKKFEKMTVDLVKS